MIHQILTQALEFTIPVVVIVAFITAFRTPASVQTFSATVSWNGYYIKK
jgi:hypothetical protein